jgi:tagatose-1,6-bisphosphate aldolase non-catalytic subunit AgaZ/GatZ
MDLARQDKSNNGFSDLIMYYDPRSPISEAFRTLRTNLEFYFSLGQKLLYASESFNPGFGFS